MIYYSKQWLSNTIIITLGSEFQQHCKGTVKHKFHNSLDNNPTTCVRKQATYFSGHTTFHVSVILFDIDLCVNIRGKYLILKYNS